MDDPYSPPSGALAAEATPSRLKLAKLAAITSGLVLAICFGMLSWHFRPEPLPDLLDWSIYFLAGIAFFTWYAADAKLRSRPRSRWMHVAIVLIQAPALVVYLLRSRGWKQGLLATAKAACVVGLAILGSAFGAMAMVVLRNPAILLP